MSVFVKGMKMPMCCAECRFLIYADFKDFVECSALVEFMADDKVPEGRREDCPLVDAEPIRHGKWIDMGDFEQCSECTATHLKTIQTVYGEATWIKSDYCPNCGAKMDKLQES